MRAPATGPAATPRHRPPPWAADAVTISRIVLLPFFILAAEATNDAVRSGAPAGRWHALVVALLAAIAASDRLDGWLARRSGTPLTQRGAILDATADRLVQWTGIGFFATRAAPAFTPLPLWLAAVLAARDALLFALWLRRRRAGVSFEHELHGKAATVAVFLALVAAVLSVRAELAGAAAALAAAAIAFSTVRYAARTGRRATPAG